MTARHGTKGRDACDEFDALQVHDTAHPFVRVEQPCVLKSRCVGYQQAQLRHRPLCRFMKARKRVLESFFSIVHANAGLGDDGTRHSMRAIAIENNEQRERDFGCILAPGDTFGLAKHAWTRGHHLVTVVRPTKHTHGM